MNRYFHPTRDNVLQTADIAMPRDYAITISSYTESEHDVLALRNRNRPEPKSKTYMEWRYLGQPSIRPPVIFKIHAPDGSCIGMAGVIFRPYYLGGQKLHVAVVGDISLDAEYRGRGLATRMIHRLNAYLQEQEIPLAWVIPTEPARKIFSACGWQTRTSLMPLVLLFDFKEKIIPLTKSKTVASLAETLINRINISRISSIKTGNFEIHKANEFDNSFDSFWEEYDKNKIFIGDRSKESLHWRYSLHPDNEFEIYKIFKKSKMVGYIICSLPYQNANCIISDIIVKNSDYIKSAMSLFLTTIPIRNGASSVRITLNAHNHYIDLLKSIGFSKRSKISSCQTYTQGYLYPYPYSLFLTSADKDV